MRRLLVTGGAGFIGANFVYYWMNNHSEDYVVVLDALTYAGNEASLDDLKDKSNFKFVAGSIADQPLVEKLLVEENLINPPFITSYPTEVSPLARRNELEGTCSHKYGHS